MADETIQTGGLEAPAGEPARQFSEVETLAMDMGWNPDHQSADGKPSRTAQEWIKSGDANARNLKREVKELKGSIERIATTADRQVKREVEQRAAQIEARFKDAVKNGDETGAATAAREFRELEQEHQPAPVANNAVADFQRANTWYGTDPDATAYAVALSTRFASEGISDPTTQLAKVREAVLKRFPEHGENTPRPKPPTLGEPGSRSMAKPREKGFDDMPDIAKGAAKRFFEAAKQRGTATDSKAFNAQYAKDYWAEQTA